MIQRPYLKSSVTVPPAMSIFMIMHAFLFNFDFNFLSVTVYVLTDSKGFQPVFLY